jgi:hypothetical protein
MNPTPRMCIRRLDQLSAKSWAQAKRERNNEKVWLGRDRTILLQATLVVNTAEGRSTWIGVQRVGQFASRALLSIQLSIAPDIIRHR